MLTVVVAVLLVLVALSIVAYANRPLEIEEFVEPVVVFTETVQDVLLTPLEVELQTLFLEEEEVIETREYYNELADIDYGDEVLPDPLDSYDIDD